LDFTLVEGICNITAFKKNDSSNSGLDKIALIKKRKELTVSTNKNEEFSANKIEGAF
jgi:hypothetical protein